MATPSEKRAATNQIAQILKDIDSKFREAMNLANEFGIKIEFNGVPGRSYGTSADYLPENWNYSDDAQGSCGGDAEWVTSSDNC